MSSINSLNTPLSFECFKNNTQNACEDARPISCPVCAKMIATNSILLHFYFDHSKVLRAKLTRSSCQDILVKATDISYDTNCIAVLIIEDIKSLSETMEKVHTDYNKALRFLLLMCSRMRMPSKNSSCKLNQETKEISNSTTQRFDQNDFIIFWTCKTDDSEMICNIKISRKDKKLSFGYTGNATHIKEKQDAKHMYQKSDSLILRGAVANDLLGSDNLMHVFVRYLR